MSKNGLTEAPLANGGERRNAQNAILPGDAACVLIGWLPVAVLVAALFMHISLPNRQLVSTSGNYSLLLSAFLIAYCSWGLGSFFFPNWWQQFRYYAPLATAVFSLLAVYELITLKLNLLPLPFFPSPVKIFEAFVNDAKILVISTLYSLRLLIFGYGAGILLGLPTGLMIGWYKKFQYWVSPLVRIIGPIPATAWIPIILVIFPTSLSGSIFLIALATWFPVTVMTWSGVANVNKSYFEIARTLGADENYLILKIALPAAMPFVFVGLFMGMGTSFITLIVAEMIGVKAGLGWYIQWAQGWGEYYKVYAAIIISAVLFSSLISLLFKVRDRALVWQRGLVKW